MTDITWIHPWLPMLVDAIPIEVKSLIDLGCGRGIVGALSRIYRDTSRLVGVDSFEPSVEFCTKFNFYDECLLHNIKKMPLPFKDKEFEVASCIEVIEHLSKDAGERLLAEMERIAKRIIITTPNMFFEQAEFDKNPGQKHASLWSVTDFRRRGYAVSGTGEMKIFGRYVKSFSKAFGPITKYIPVLSVNLICIKNA